MIWFSCAWTWTGTWLWREIKRKKNVKLLLYALQKRKMSVKRKGKFGIERPNRMEQYKSARFFTLLLARSLKQRERARESVFSLIWLGWGSICQRAEKKSCICTSLSPDSVSVQGKSDGAFCYRRFICQGQNSFLPLLISNITLWSL
jgi:hypothetical protein